jgi:hypothetical protein
MSDTIPQEAIAFFRRSEDYSSHYRHMGLEDLRFSYGGQWPPEMQNQRHLEKRPMFTINETDSYIRQVVNQIRQQRPRIKAHGVNSSADAKIAEIITGLMRHIEELSDAATAYDMAAEFAVRMGWGYWRLRADYCNDDSFEQDVFIEPIWNPFSVSFDPYSHAPDGSDQTKCLISGLLSKEEFKIIYPDAQETSFTVRAVGDTTGEWLTKDSIRWGEFYKIDKEKHKLIHLSDGSSWWHDEIPDSELLERAKIKIKGDRISWRHRVNWYKVTAVEVLESRTLPGRWIPVVPVYGSNIVVDGKVQRFGMTRHMRDPQQILNFTQTAIIETVALAPKAKWVAAAEAVNNTINEWQAANVSANALLRYEHRDEQGNEIPMPQRQAPEPPPEGWMVAAANAHEALQRVAGMFDPAMRRDGPMSGKALNAEQQQSDMSSYHFYDNFTRSVKHTGRIALSWIPAYYGKRRVMRIIGDDGKPDLVTINDDQAVGKIENDLTVGQYDVVMETGPGYNSKRQEAVESMAPLLQGPNNPLMQIAGDLFFRNMDFPGADVIADRLAAANPLAQIDDKSDIPPRAQIMIKQLQQQLQQAGQQLQAAGLQIKLKKEDTAEREMAETHRTIIKEEAETQRERMRDATKQADMHTKAHATLGSAEINAAAEIMKQIKQHGHERIMAAIERIANQEEAENARPNGAVNG